VESPVYIVFGTYLFLAEFLYIIIVSTFFITLNFNNMGNLLYLIAVILVIIWAIGFLGGSSFGMGGLIHILLVIAVIAILLKVIRRA